MKDEKGRVMNAAGFDTWSHHYEQDVRRSDDSHSYPFAGYARIQEALLQHALTLTGRRALDLGIGTGTLAARLIQNGFHVTGIDFSDSMLHKVRQHSPTARLIAWDFAQGLPPVLEGEAFDLILCNYAIHHLTRHNNGICSGSAFCASPPAGAC